MTRTRTPWLRIRRPARRSRPPARWRHEDHLSGDRLPEATHVPRALR